MIHYHGMPITPESDAGKIFIGGHAFVSYAHSYQLGIAASVCQSFAIDNGAFSAWKSGKPITDWDDFYEWLDPIIKHPAFDFAVIPDVIDGGESDNDRLVRDWPFGTFTGAPVWHMHESLTRLGDLMLTHPRICIGSSAEYAQIGTNKWWVRMAEAMRILCDDHGRPQVKIHGLRMLDPEIFTRFPFSSADSTNIARNVKIDQAWKGTYIPASVATKGIIMRERIERNSSSEVFVQGINIQHAVDF